MPNRSCAVFPPIQLPGFVGGTAWGSCSLPTPGVRALSAELIARCIMPWPEEEIEEEDEEYEGAFTPSDRVGIQVPARTMPGPGPGLGLGLYPIVTCVPLSSGRSGVVIAGTNPGWSGG